jgi:FKBP-type peptidyl-prolyl cis-trans isomerase FklB
MQKPFIMAVNAVAVGIMLAGSALAQQSSAPSGQAAPPASAQKAPAAKATPATPAKAAAPAPSPLTTDKQKDSYAVGINIGLNLKKQPVDLDAPSVLRGIKDALAGTKPLLTDDEIDAGLKQLQDEGTKRVAEANMKEGEAFLAENKTKDGVVTLPSGLQYKIVSAGTGAQPALSDTVVCNYKGTFINGTEFDSSYKRGRPASFPVAGVIKGWTEALQLMPVGSKWQLFVPSELAYGPRGGGGGAIGPNQTLVFEVELISIQAK